ncbi:MAG: histidinol dehydrogenase [Anderseniella sp.]|nr:histidinol dehydrogenase [Anderseniella sp.]
MTRLLDSGSTDFETRFQQLLGDKREQSADVNDAVAAILSDVRARGDEAVREYTEKFDRFDLPASGARMSQDDINAWAAKCEPEVVDALEAAAARIRAYHQRQLPGDDRYTDEMGVELGHRWTAVEAAGLYVPGGLAAYPSSVLMNAIPAHVAGVERLVMVVPTPDGIVNPQVIAAARIAGVSEIHTIGGAQAVGALAYGTASIAPVAKIVGPGNAYVAAAKRQVFGTVGIDMIAGPSEVLVMADDTANAGWVAADLLAQAEHDHSAQSILICTSEAFARAVMAEVDSQLATLPKADIAGASWRDFGCIITVPSLMEAVPLVDRLAPEHLEIVSEDCEEVAARVRNAGAIFLGAFTPEAVGDYVGGPNHVLPTARSARYSSGLNVLDFMKRTSILKCSADALRAIGPDAVTLGRSEGLEAHARSVAVRLNLP